MNSILNLEGTGENGKLPKPRRDLTTGEAAVLLRCSQQKIIRAIDNGSIEGAYKLPSSQHRRIPYQSIERYARENDIPLDESMVPRGLAGANHEAIHIQRHFERA